MLHFFYTDDYSIDVHFDGSNFSEIKIHLKISTFKF